MIFTALKPQTYRGQKIKKDEAFTVYGKDVRLLQALGRIGKEPITVAAVGAMTTLNTSALLPPLREDDDSQHTVEQEPDGDETFLEGAIAPIAKPGDDSYVEPVVHEIVQEKLDDNLILNIMDDVESEDEGTMNQEVEPQHGPEYYQVLRTRAESLGIRVDGRWSSSRIQREIDEHNQRTYQHMDMQPE